MAKTSPILSTQEDPIVKKRAKITQLVELKNIKGLKQLGITAIIDEEDNDDTCFETAFPPTLYQKNILGTVISDWDDVKEPKAGDVAIYQTSNGRITHVGRATNTGKVISRWGQGGLICEHNPLDIPLFAGVDVKVVWYREPRQNKAR